MLAKVLTATMVSSLLTFGAAVPAFAQTAERKEFQVLMDVAHEVRRYVNYTVFDDVSGSIDNGVVTLAGKVTMPYKRDDIERRVRACPA